MDRRFSLLLLVTAMVVALAGCTPNGSLCRAGQTLLANGLPDHARYVYTRALAQGLDCAEEGLATASNNEARAADKAAAGLVAQHNRHLEVAKARYRAALALDVTNQIAIAGLARLGAEPPPPPRIIVHPSPPWWARPLPYLLALVVLCLFLVVRILRKLCSAVSEPPAEQNEPGNERDSTEHPSDEADRTPDAADATKRSTLRQRLLAGLGRVVDALERVLVRLKARLESLQKS